MKHIVDYENCRTVETFPDACIGAGESISLLAMPIEPDAEDHEDDPTGGPNACDECRLLHHIRDLLGKADLVLRRHGVAVRI